MIEHLITSTVLMHSVDKNVIWKSNESAVKIWIVAFGGNKIIGSYSYV